MEDHGRLIGLLEQQLLQDIEDNGENDKGGEAGGDEGRERLGRRDDADLLRLADLHLDQSLDVRPVTANRGNDSDTNKDSDLMLVGPNFSPLLVKTIQVLRHNFPTSPMASSVVPVLRRTGPSAFALGASTALYNETLGYLFEQTGDLVRIAHMLVEMERAIVQLDDGTLAILTRILDHGRQAARGIYGDAVKTIWARDQTKKALEDIINLTNRLRASKSS